LFELQRPKHLKRDARFPALKKSNNSVTSDSDVQYNCVAFAAGVTNRKWWPDFHPDFYWPPGSPRINTIASFIKAFETLGYESCNDGKYEHGFEKVVFYVKDGLPTHAALQVGRNKWKSKLGNWYDVEHTAEALSGGATVR
jgi:hypothetical protein